MPMSTPYTEVGAGYPGTTASCELLHVGAGNRIQVLCKCSK